MPVRRSTVGPAGGYDGVEVALRSASGFAGALCAFVPRSSGQRGSEGVWRPVKMGLSSRYHPLVFRLNGRGTPEMLDDYETTMEAAKRLGRHPSYICHLAREGWLRAR